MNNKKNNESLSETLNNELNSLNNELKSCEECIERIKEEINLKRRNLTEYQSKQKTIESKIKAKRYEMLENLVSDKLEITIEELAGAVKSGEVLVEKTKTENSVLLVNNGQGDDIT